MKEGMKCRITEILSKYEKKEFTKEELKEINARWEKESQRINREFAKKQAQSIEDSKHIYITF